MKRNLVLAVVLCVFGGGCDGRSDQERIQGAWRMWEMNGWFEFDLGATKGGPSVLTFTGSEFRFTNAPTAPGHSVSGAFTCDATKSPKEITFSYRGRTVTGIYSLSGARLQICVGNDDRVPPKDFQGGPGERPAFIDFRRPQ